MAAHTTYIDVILRSIAVYAFMIVALRVLGKKELSQLNTADVILILLISNSVQNAMVGDNISLEGGLLAALVLFLLNYLLKVLQYKFKIFNVLLDDKPEILIHAGKPDYKILSKLSITHEELLEAVHEHGLENIAEVKLAIMEMDGNISIISGDTDLRQTHYKRRKNRKNLVKMS
jgi:uncharacterized membrane protein YcaP (DUF421 family)